MSRCVLKDFLEWEQDDHLKTDPLQKRSDHHGNYWLLSREVKQRKEPVVHIWRKKIKWAPLSPCSLCRHRRSTKFKCFSPILLSDEAHESYSFHRKPTESWCPSRAKLCYCAWQSSCQDKKYSLHRKFFCTTKWSPWIKSPADDLRPRN